MPIPPFDNNGLLPPGIFDCTLEEIQAVYCSNPHRQTLFDGLMSFLQSEWYPHNIALPIFIDGSFVRNKPLPSDVDIVIDLTDQNDQVIGVGIALHFRRDELKDLYSVDVWPKHPKLGNDLGKSRISPRYEGVVR
jgi:hypothetical protein